MSLSVIAATAAASASTMLLQSIIEWVKNGGLERSYREGSSDSLIEFTRSTRNDFLTVIEEDLLAQTYIGAIQQSVLSMVSGYYLSSVSLLIDIPGIEVVKTLDRLSNNRDPIETILGAGSSVLKYVGTESFAYGLPSHNIGLESVIYQGVGLEAFEPLSARHARVALEYHAEEEALALESLDDTRIRSEQVKQELDRERIKTEKERQQQGRSNERMNAAKTSEQLKASQLKREQLQQQMEQDSKSGGSRQATTAGFGKSTLDVVKETTNLSVGKVLDVTFRNNGNEVTVPVTIRLAATATDAESLKNILTFGSGKHTFKERYYRAKAGELKYISDLLLCNDIRNEARKARMRDKSGYLEQMMRSQAKNRKSGLLSMTPTLNSASAVLIITEETAKGIELDIGGSLERFKVRQKVFMNTAAMIIVVVDQRWGMVRFYHRSIDAVSEVSVNELKRAANGGGNNIEDILLAYNAGSAPTI